MNLVLHRPLVAAALLGMAGGGVAWGQDPPVAAGAGVEETVRLQEEVARLRQQNQILQESLVEANQREAESAEVLGRIKLRLEALGKDLLDGGDERTVKAVADLAILDRRLRRMEEAAIRLSSSVQGYLRTAIAADPEARAEVEAQLRELEVELGLRGRPEQNIERGNLQHAKVKSIDEQSGLVVLNVGEREKARIGMNFSIMRDDQLIAEAMVAETRAYCCGFFIQRLEQENNPVRLNDTASLKTN